MAVISLSRTYGSGGLAVARRAAEICGYACLDKTLIAEVARMAEVPERTVASFDEVGSGFLSSLLSRFFLNQTVPGAYALDLWGGAFGEMAFVPEPPPGYAGGGGVLDRDHLVSLTEQVIRAAADRGDIVIVGRGAQVILAEREDTLHVRVTAPLEDRARNVAEREGIDLGDAIVTVRRTDQARERYLRQYYRTELEDPCLYHMILNTAGTGIELAAALIAGASRLGLRRRQGSETRDFGRPPWSHELLTADG